MDRAKFDEQYKNFHDDRFEDIFETPVLDDDSKTHTGKDFDWSYLSHCHWAASRISTYQPKVHVDLGSYAYFAAIVSPFIRKRFTFVDVRPLDVELPEVVYVKADFRKLPFEDGSIESVSCLHSLDHVGLGRYGDDIDPRGDAKAAREIERILAPDGRALIVVPMNARKRVNFNAHRIYDGYTLSSLFPGLRMRFWHRFHDKKEVQEVPDGDYTGCYEFWKI